MKPMKSSNGNGDLGISEPLTTETSGNDNSGTEHVELGIEPPFIWPEARWHHRLGKYKTLPPFDECLREVDLVSGIIVGAADQFVSWLRRLVGGRKDLTMKLVLVLYPACATKSRHLSELLALQHACREGQCLELNVLPIWLEAGLPPTVLQMHNKKSKKSWMSIGSVGNFGSEEWTLTSFNVVFKPDDVLRDQWRNWFEYMRQKAALLTKDIFGDKMVKVRDSQRAEEELKLIDRIQTKDIPLKKKCHELWGVIQGNISEDGSPPSVSEETGDGQKEL